MCGGHPGLPGLIAMIYLCHQVSRYRLSHHYLSERMICHLIDRLHRSICDKMLTQGEKEADKDKIILELQMELKNCQRQLLFSCGT